MKKIIFKKLFKDIAIFFTYSCLSIALIVWVIQAVNFLDFVSEDGHNFNVYFLYTSLNFPRIINKIIPFIFFISLFYILIKYEDNNEILIFWTIGINKKDFVNKLIKFSFLILLIQIFLGTVIVPITQDKARSFLRDSKIDFFPSLIKEKKFIDTVSDLTIFVDKKDKISGELINIFLKDNQSDGKNTQNSSNQTIYAKRGNIINRNGVNYLILKDGKITNFNNGKKNSFDFTSTEFNLSKYSTKSTTFPKIQEIKTINLLSCMYSIYIKNYISDKKLMEYLSSKKVKEVQINNNDISGSLVDGTSFTSYTTNYDKLMKQILVSDVNLSTISKKKFPTFFSKHKFLFFCQPGNLKEVIQEFLKRIYLPLYIPLLSLIACLLVLCSKNDINYKKYRIKLFVFGVLIIVISEISIRYTGSNNLSNIIIFLIIPIITFVIIYKFFINKVKNKN